MISLRAISARAPSEAPTAFADYTRDKMWTPRATLALVRVGRAAFPNLDWEVATTRAPRLDGDRCPGGVGGRRWCDSEAGTGRCVRGEAGPRGSDHDRNGVRDRECDSDRKRDGECDCDGAHDGDCDGDSHDSRACHCGEARFAAAEATRRALQSPLRVRCSRGEALQARLLSPVECRHGASTGHAGARHRGALSIGRARRRTGRLFRRVGTWTAAAQ
jgi:hypothetical protein